MDSIAPELLVELAPQLLYALAGVVLTIVGIGAEYTSVQYFGGGDLELAIWFAAFGAVALYAGLYGIGYQKLLARAIGE